MFCIEELSEYKVLFNVFFALKYGIDEDETSRLIRSPYFSDMFNKLLIEMLNGYKEISIIDENTELARWHIDNRLDERAKIKQYLLEMEFWKDLDETTKEELVKILFSPFNYSEDSVSTMKKDIDDYNK